MTHTIPNCTQLHRVFESELAGLPHIRGWLLCSALGATTLFKMQARCSRWVDFYFTAQAVLRGYRGSPERPSVSAVTSPEVS